MEDQSLELADSDFYVPVDWTRDGGEPITPTTMPSDWTHAEWSGWQQWSPPGLEVPEEGWKVHVSTRWERRQHTVDVVAAACVSFGISFKHIASERFFGVLHAKYGARSQAGKFCALYPPDEAVAGELMGRLARDLAGEDGPYVLSDRRFGDSHVVYYRYGAYRARRQIQHDGTNQDLVRDGDGRDVPDKRLAFFSLPPGITDPFSPEAANGRKAGAPLLHERYSVTGVIRHSSAGGAYEAQDLHTGGRVFVKEARPYVAGFSTSDDAQSRLRAEHAMLVRLHAQAPGLAPEPIDLFADWEHLFLVTEFLEGKPLQDWAAVNNPASRIGDHTADAGQYADRVRRILASLRRDLARLHGLGLQFGDLSHNNVLIGDEDRTRLIDFETVTGIEEPRSTMATIGYKAPAILRDDGLEPDEYAYRALVLLMLFPLHRPIELGGSARLPLLRRDIEMTMPVPDDLWEEATAAMVRLPARTVDSAYAVPTAEDLDRSPSESLRTLAVGLRDDILAVARTDEPDWLFPPAPEAYSTNRLCFAYGAAGVLHALVQCGVPVDSGLADAFDDRATKSASDLAPGLNVGLAGIALALAEVGHVETAAVLLRQADRHRLARSSGNLDSGLAGIGMAHLGVFACTKDPVFLENAARSADCVLTMAPDELLGEKAGPGLDQGAAGVALFLCAVAEATGDRRYAKTAVTMLHGELDRADMSAGRPMFRSDHGVVNYLSVGAAGVGVACSRVASLTDDERCRSVLPAVFGTLRTATAVEPGLRFGLSGVAYAFAEHAAHAGTPEDTATALRIGTGIAKYVTEHHSGLRVVGSFGLRYSADLGMGSAGVLLALSRIVDGGGVQLYPTPRS